MTQSSFVSKQLPVIFRIIIAGMFLLSAVSKLYPSPYFALTTFELKQLVPMGFSDNFAAYFSRTLIGVELSIGFLLLQKNWLKSLIIPASFLMLLVFSVHLSYEIATKGNVGNCGCFGSLLPMTPVQALIKNIIGMAMLVLVFKKSTKDSAKDFYFVLSVLLASILLIFMLGPIAKKTTMVSSSDIDDDDVETVEVDTMKTKVDSTHIVPIEKMGLNVNKKDVKNDDVKEVEKVLPLDEPKAKKSGYAKFYTDIDKGRKILCFYVPGCDHCRDAAKELHELSKSVQDFPEMKIIFMDEEAELIPDFFAYSGQKLPFKIIDVASFWTTLGGDKDTPGVFYMWNGNMIKQYDGTGPKAFKKDEFKGLVQKKWSELK